MDMNDVLKLLAPTVQEEASQSLQLFVLVHMAESLPPNIGLSAFGGDVVEYAIAVTILTQFLLAELDPETKYLRLTSIGRRVFEQVSKNFDETTLAKLRAGIAEVERLKGIS